MCAGCMVKLVQRAWLSAHDDNRNRHEEVQDPDLNQMEGSVTGISQIKDVPGCPGVRPG